MGINTKLYVAFPRYEKTSDIIPFLRAASQAIRESFPVERLRGRELAVKLHKKDFCHGDPVFLPPTLNCSGIGQKITEGYRLDFVYNGEERSVGVYFDCDSDFLQEVPGPYIVLSLGFWGSSVQIMEHLAQTLNAFGDVYLRENDFEDGPLRKFSKREPVPEELAYWYGTQQKPE